MTRRAQISLRIFFVLSLIFAGSTRLDAQYYDWGQEPSSVRWLQLRTENGRIVFPDKYEAHAVRLMHYMNGVLPYSGYGFRYGAMDMPTLVHTRNFSPNGLVMLAPNRMELLAIPPASTYATPWMKQLVAHESRHRVQYNNLNRGVIRALGNIFGQHGSIIGLGFMPYWAMEGDAVHAETEMTAYGRALQPSFTIAYRAMLLEGDAGKYPEDKFFSGSYVDYLPDHYHLGYQISSYAYTKYGENVWNRVADYGSRRPYQIFTTHIALKKYYSTSTTKLLRETLADLENYWRSQPLVDNSASIINTPVMSYTTYSTPVAVEKDALYALKSDLDRTSRIVRVDMETGEERVVHRTGIVNTGLSVCRDRLWWTEMRQSTFWQQKVNSVMCWYDPATGKSGTCDASRRAMFPAETGEQMPAFVEYDYSGRYAIRDGKRSIAIPDTVSVHGLAYDRGLFYFIGLSDSGMWIGSASHDAGIEMVTPPGHVTLSGLRAADGKLYYNSILSGKDEAYAYDLASGMQYRLTESRYGSFDPAPAAEGVVVTTYTPDGYMLARQDAASGREDAWSDMPRDIVNPPRLKWDVPCVDSMPTVDTTTVEVKKFRKWGNALRVHSWAPMWYEPDNMLGETNLNVNIGVTLLSHNLLNSTYAVLGYKYTDEGSFVTASLKLHGLAPKFEVETEYGTMDQLAYAPRAFIESGGRLSGIDRENYFSITARAYLPVMLDGGHHFRRLTPMVEFEHENSKLYYFDDPYRSSFHLRNGFQKVKMSLQFTDNVRMAHRDFLPRWGYAMRVTYTSNPFNGSFGDLWSGYARAYLPGIGRHHSLMLRTGLQAQERETFNFRQKEVFPRGARYDFSPQRYASLAVDYQLPVWYPDGGIRSLLYFRRVRLNLCYDYARFKVAGRWDDIHSYGADITLDLVPVRLPASTVPALTLTIHKATNRDNVVIGAQFVMPL